jgi:Outer membrane lipoprotein carrier protein LolA-like
MMRRFELTCASVAAAIMVLTGTLTTASMVRAAAPVAGMTPVRQGEVLRGRFKQIRELKGFDAPLQSNGSFVVAPGRGLIWRVEAPFPMATIMSASGLLQDVNGKEAMRVPANKMPFIAKLYDMLGGALSGDLEALSSSFVITREAEAKGWRFRMVPKNAGDPNMPLKSIVVRGQAFVEEVQMVKDNGDKELLVLIEQKATKGELAADEVAMLDRVGK